MRMLAVALKVILPPWRRKSPKISEALFLLHHPVLSLEAVHCLPEGF
ncbi:hypothetical protein [Actinacidiphila oryziradicis]|nr:hypothetical protein [Actinacidiphila oryziradicis]MCW2868885.1 hypothetical protein [Actinacidiphila oryziradicis]